jgi:hypothetical protein
VKPGNPEHSQ